MQSPENWVEASYNNSTINKINNTAFESRTLYTSVPLVSALSWSIIEQESAQLIAGKAHKEKREIASLTKIMTAYVSIDFCKSQLVDINKTYLEVSKTAAYINGTVAGLRMGHRLTIKDLIYALLLPSGNDAAIVLAEGIGKRIFNKECKKTKCRTPSSLSKIYIDLFVKQMNKTALKLSLNNTLFSNPHGLADKGNRSTAEDIGRLSAIAKKEIVLNQVVKTPVYHCSAIDERGNLHNYCWENTNKLLALGYDGVKTGMTPTAGPCLILSQTCNNISIIVTVLGSRTQEHKWIEGVQILNWAMHKLLKFQESKPKSTSMAVRKKGRIANFMVYRTLLS